MLIELAPAQVNEHASALTQTTSESILLAIRLPNVLGQLSEFIFGLGLHDHLVSAVERLQKSERYTVLPFPFGIDLPEISRLDQSDINRALAPNHCRQREVNCAGVQPQSTTTRHNDAIEIHTTVRQRLRNKISHLSEFVVLLLAHIRSR